MTQIKWDCYIARSINSSTGIGSALGNLGNVYCSLGKYNQAIEHYQKLLDIAQKIGDRATEGGTLGNLGIAYKCLGKYNKAIDYYQQLWNIARELEDPF